MSILKNETEVIINCICGCDDSIHIKIDKEDDGLQKDKRSDKYRHS